MNTGNVGYRTAKKVDDFFDRIAALRLDRGPDTYTALCHAVSVAYSESMGEGHEIEYMRPRRPQKDTVTFDASVTRNGSRLGTVALRFSFHGDYVRLQGEDERLYEIVGDVNASV